MKKYNFKNHTFYILIALTLIVGIISAGSFVIKNGFTPDMIIHIMPKNLFFAFLFMMLFFALKSITIFFPITILFICNGIIFPKEISFIVSFIGLFICRSLPYFVGYKGYEQSKMDQLIGRYPQFSQLKHYQNQNTIFVSFIAYMIGLPGDLVSLYLGISHIPYRQFIVGSLLGSLVALVIETLLGEYILSSSSWTHFFILLLIRVMCIVVSLLIKRITQRKY